ncbi:hypothetical protein [Candidatus Pelagibacter sp.]|uniref:hypothetical protein n=1 Tax=Candidatus Pelagibacter sp. TaxID=2024849 RepID=UPI003F842906
MQFNENLYHYFLLKNSNKLINKFYKNYFKNEYYFEQYNLENSIKNYSYYLLVNSEIIKNIYLDYKQGKLKDFYKVETKELIFFAKEILLLIGNKKKIKIISNINILQNVKIFAEFFFTFLFFNFFTIKRKFNKKILFISSHKKFIPFFNKTFSNINSKEILNKHNLKKKIKFNNISFRVKTRKIPPFNKIKFLSIYIILKNIIFFENLIDQDKVKIIFFCEGDGLIYKNINAVYKNKIKIICIQWGSINYKFAKAPFHILDYDLFLSWGNYYKKFFQKINKKLKVINLGNLNLNLIKNKNKDKILICLPQKSIISSNEFYDSLVNLTENLCIKFPNKIIIRPHPQDNFYEKYIFKKSIKNLIYDSSDDLSLTLSKCKIVISAASSILIEGGRVGTIPILWYPKNNGILWGKSIKKLIQQKSYKFLIFNEKIIIDQIHKLMSNNNYYLEIRKILLKILKDDISYLKDTSKTKLKKIIQKNL